VDGFSGVQLPVVGSKLESPLHLVPALLPVFPVCICVVVVVEVEVGDDDGLVEVVAGVLYTH
jgi:hypothetical protein